jgi:hypothetical protein
METSAKKSPPLANPTNVGPPPQKGTTALVMELEWPWLAIDYKIHLRSVPTFANGNFAPINHRPHRFTGDDYEARDL